MMNRLSALVVLLPSLALGGLLFSCTSNGTTSDEEHLLKIGRVAPKPDARMAQRSGENLEKIGMGYWIFQRKCLECHEARVPKDPAASDWHPVMQGMSWNAGLSADEESAVLSYLRAAVR